MSFFKKLSDKFDDLSIGSDRKDGQRGWGDHSGYPGGSGPPVQQYPPLDQYQSPPPGQHQSLPPRNYSSPPLQSYNSGPPAPVYSPPRDKAPIPAGWVPQFDNHYQRWYYVEEATGRSQWEAPGYTAPGPVGEARGHDTGYGYSSQGGNYAGHGGYGVGYSGQPDYNGPYGGSSEKAKKSNSGMLLGAAGGLAVGAVGGALIANALDDSDDEHRYAAPASAPAPTYGAEPIYDTGIPQYNYEGEKVSESDRESVASAREDYQKALQEAASSSASSSDREELEEAREEYQEEYEEAYYDE